LSLTLNLVAVAAMWRHRQFTRYLAYHLVWLGGIAILTVIIVVLFLYHSDSCKFDVTVLFLTRGYDIFSILLRLVDRAFVKRIASKFKAMFTQKNLKGSPLLHRRLSEASLFRVRYSAGLDKLGGQDMSGVFQSLSVKVRHSKFIMDSLITLTLFQSRKIEDAQHGLVREHL
jgi:hypothetical protein